VSGIGRVKVWRQFLVEKFSGHADVRADLRYKCSLPDCYGYDFWQYLIDLAEGRYREYRFGPVRRKRLADALRDMGRLGGEA